MSRKTLWDAELIGNELQEAYQGLAAIPKSHLRKLVRALHLFEQSERWQLLERLGAREDRAFVHGYTAGMVTAVAGLRETMRSIIDGTFEEQVREQEEYGPDYRERDWDDRFGG